MTLETLTTFFQWCTLLNIGLYAFTAVMICCMPDFIYKMHRRWFALNRESFNAILYGYLGLYKILLIVFNLTPYLALLLMQ